jgi:hypothetical protein
MQPLSAIENYTVTTKDGLTEKVGGNHFLMIAIRADVVNAS